jgi:hypothetical protein
LNTAAHCNLKFQIRANRLIVSLDLVELKRSLTSLRLEQEAELQSGPTALKAQLGRAIGAIP